MDFNNIDLNSNYEKDQNIMDSLNTNDLLLMINCNVREINEKTVKREFEEWLKIAVNSARETFEANKKNITKYALKERNKR
jgi:hypothetical protein